MTPARAYLFGLEQFGIKLGLEQIRALVAAMDRPDEAYRCLIVAGTNGKGSVTAMIERGLRAAGYRTGRYTSPHLVALEERFAIDGVDVESDALDEAILRMREAATALPAPPSYFEATTAVAFDLFRASRVDVAVLEVGLGGRLDATNVADSELAAITRIDFDHQQYLGHTLDAIAREKAGVIKPGRTVVMGANTDEVTAVIAGRAAEVGARFVRAADGTDAVVVMRNGHADVRFSTPRGHYAPVTLALAGRHQVENATTALRVLEELQAIGTWRIPDAAVRAALTEAEWPARLEQRTWRGHTLLIDGAHNPAGARALAAHIRDTYGRPLPIVIGVMRDKDLDGIITALAPVASRFICTAPESPRATDPTTLRGLVERLAPGVPVEAVREPFEAVHRGAGDDSPVVVCGSLYLAGAIRAKTS